MTDAVPTITTVITQREDASGMTDGGVIKTPTGEPNITVVAMPWWQQVLIRAARVYISGLLGFIGAGATGAIPLGDFNHTLVRAASLAVAPAVVSLLMNAAEMLGKLDTTNYAKLRA